MEHTTIVDAKIELRRKRYEQVSALLKKWIEEKSPFDAIVAAELEKADDLTMRCEEPDETTP